MTSMLAGNQRRATTGKLTVLGTVPKPINLPSQRLENHGLDPNIEIVPKGTLTWGSRPSSATPNAWGTSTSFPHIDGSAGSPSHRPSSGSGTRPSTAGSDKSHEPVSNAWGPNSRPSSASGIITSSQISAASARPQSADTRLGSCHLSRFADNPIDGTISWGAAGAAERLVTGSSKSSGFTLSSGDFPSLGSNMNSDTNSQRGPSSQGRPHSSQGCPHSSQGHPALASGIDSQPMQNLVPQLAGNKNTDHLDHGTVNTWKADHPPYAGHDASPRYEQDDWNRDPHPAPSYRDMNIPPPHYDSWHNPSFHSANGSWYRGGPSGGPARPGSCPVNYPHVPRRPLSTPQLQRQDAGAGGFYPNICRPCRPYVSQEQYMGPGHSDIPVRPGPYNGPMPYGGYYGPHRPNFYISTEREASIMAQPFHNEYPTHHQNYDSANFHARPSGYATVVNKEDIEPNHAYDTQGQYRVLLKQQDGSGNCDKEKEHSATADSLVLERGNHHGGSSQKREEIAVSSSLPGEAVASESTRGVEVRATNTVLRDLVADSCKAADDSLVRRPEAANAPSGDLQQYPVTKKNASLMEKVESLNNKARFADNCSDSGPNSKEKLTCSMDMISRADTFTKVASTSSIDSRYNRCGNGEWMRKSPESELFMSSTRTSVKTGVLESDASTKILEIREFHLEASGEGGSHTTSSVDPADQRAQRAKMKEIAAQRAKELQREEEERTREQKAKALAKLEELNRRTLAESSNLKPIHASSESSDVRTIKQETRPGAAPTADPSYEETSSGACGTSDRPETMNGVDDNGTKDSLLTTKMFSEDAAQALHPSVVLQAQSLLMRQNTDATPKTTQETSSEIRHYMNAKQKQVSYRQKHSIPHENSMCMKQTTAGSIGGPKCSSEFDVNTSSTDSYEEPHIRHNKKKHNRTGRNNNSKSSNDDLKSSTSPSLLHVEGNTDKLQVEAISVPSESSNETVGSLSSKEASDVPENQGISGKTDENQSKVSNQLKSHPHRKTYRNQQANKLASRYHATESVMWAPVKPPAKSDADEVCQCNVIESTNTSGKSGVDLQNVPKVKRAEIVRYVPKPVAEEQSQQVNFQQTSHTIEKSETGIPSDESGRLDERTGEKSAAASYTGHREDHKHNKHARTNASWHQQSLAESQLVEGNTAQRASDQCQTSNAGNFLIQQLKQLKHTDDGWNSNDFEVPSESGTSIVVSKSYGASRQRRQPYEAHRASGNYYSGSYSTVETTEKNEHSSDLSHIELRKNHTKTASQNAVAENIKPSWQPKSQGYTNGNQGNRGNRGGQRGANTPATMNEDNSTSSQRTPVSEVSETHYQESRSEWKVDADQMREHYNGRAQRGYDNNYRARDSAHKTGR